MDRFDKIIIFVVIFIVSAIITVFAVAILNRDHLKECIDGLDYNDKRYLEKIEACKLIKKEKNK